MWFVIVPVWGSITVLNPQPRSHSSLSAHPIKPELMLFGGEYIDGKKTQTYNDLFVYRVAKRQWHKITVPKAPPPRSGHQAVVASAELFSLD
jgi:N-acetylneuraminic acid mutarotase